MTRPIPKRYKNYVTVRTNTRAIVLRMDWRVGEDDERHTQIVLDEAQAEMIGDALSRAIRARNHFGIYPSHSVFLELEIVNGSDPQ